MNTNQQLAATPCNVNQYSKAVIRQWAAEIPTTRTIDRAVMAELVNRANSEGVCWPSFALLSKATSACERTVRTSLKRLQDGGAITRQYRYAKSGRRTSNLYRLNVGAECYFKAKTRRVTTGKKASSLPAKIADGKKPTTGILCGYHFVDPLNSKILPEQNLELVVESSVGLSAAANGFSLSSWASACTVSQ